MLFGDSSSCKMVSCYVIEVYRAKFNSEQLQNKVSHIHAYLCYGHGMDPKHLCLHERQHENNGEIELTNKLYKALLVCEKFSGVYLQLWVYEMVEARKISDARGFYIEYRTITKEKQYWTARFVRALPNK